MNVKQYFPWTKTKEDTTPVDENPMTFDKGVLISDTDTEYVLADHTTLEKLMDKMDKKEAEDFARAVEKTSSTKFPPRVPSTLGGGTVPPSYPPPFMPMPGPTLTPGWEKETEYTFLGTTVDKWAKLVRLMEELDITVDDIIESMEEAKDA